MRKQRRERGGANVEAAKASVAAEKGAAHLENQLILNQLSLKRRAARRTGRNKNAPVRSPSACRRRPPPPRPPPSPQPPGEGRGVSDWYGVRDAACPISTKEGGGGSTCDGLGSPGAGSERPSAPPPAPAASHRRRKSCISESIHSGPAAACATRAGSERGARLRPASFTLYPPLPPVQSGHVSSIPPY